MKPKPLPKNGKNSIFPTTPNGTELASYDQKLNFILHTSAQVFAEKGYDRASLRDISRATGFSLAGLYYYF
ncbi:MAG TPA: helix-turn-helix domain-containing protein, partial [Acidobacteriota bacterium]|nr:helix-turn-helix domain-containing protein [Acidobacteriota bacterium]